MAANGVLGNGVRVGYSATSPVSWNKVAQLRNVDVPTQVADVINTDVHGVGAYHRSMPGMMTVGDMTLTLLADLNAVTTPSHAALLALQLARTTVWWRIEVPTDRAATAYKAFEFQGYVKDYNLKTPIEGVQELDIVVGFDGDSYSIYPAVGASATGMS